MGKFTRHFLAIACLQTLLANGYRTFAQNKPSSISSFSSPDTLQITPTKNEKQQVYFQTPNNFSTASTAVVLGKEFSRTPVVSYPMALAGRLVGLSATQTNGQPLSEGYTLKLRGQAPLVVIDGIPRALSEIGMEEIESITVLKDAVSTAMFGIRGSGGVLSVVTKKGFVGKQQVNFTVQTGVQTPTKNLMGNPLNAYQYAQLYNEALVNDGSSPTTNGYSQAALTAYQNGLDPYKFPDVNWKDQILKNSAAITRYNLNARGGNKFVKYFINLEHFSQDGLLKTSDANKYNTNANLRGYFVRSNVDLSLTDEITAGIAVQGRIINTTNPGNAGADNLFSAIIATPNSAYPIYNADGTFGGASQFQNNIVAQNIGAGYSQSNTRTVLSDFYLKRTLDELAKGLWIKARVSFFSNLNENVVRNKSFAVFEQTGASSTGQAIYRQYGTNGAQANTNNISFQNRSDFEELSMGYSHSFKKSGLDAVLLANRDNLVNGSNLPYVVQSIAGHAAYNYNRKYLLEVSFSESGANRYPDKGGFKYGFFPAVGLGWSISEEKFMQKYNWLNHLKLYGSYGKTGRDNASYYLYQQVYNAVPVSIFGSSAAAATTNSESYLANSNITWEKSKKLNVGIDAALLKNRLSFNAEYYSGLYTDLSIVRGNNTALLGISYPNENIGRQRYYGWEGQINWAQKSTKLGYFASLNASFQNSTLLYAAEANQKYSWMNKTGNPVGQNYGYIAEGLFRSQQEITGHATIEGYTPQPGDIKYKDLNGDGVINQYDQTNIGLEKPVVLFGARIGFNIKNFDFSTLLQGTVNQQVYLSGASYWEFQGGTGQAYETQLDRWTTATANSANYPRLTTNSGPKNGAVNNFVNSSFWLRNGNFMRVKTIELGYTIPASALKKLHLQSARIFANGLNLFTISSNAFNGADPENYTGAYPIEKVVSMGINIQM